MTSRRGLSIRYLLLIANAFIVLVPLFGVVFLRLWDAHLMRVSEEQLIAESVLLSEAWRDRLGGSDAAPGAAVEDDDAPEPMLGRRYSVLPPMPRPTHVVAAANTPAWQSGAELAPFVARVARRNGSEVELLDPRGCAIAATDVAPGACLDALPEVRAAIDGQYGAAARERADAGRAPWNEVQRWLGSIQVATALPVHFGGRVVGVVRMAQPSSSPLEAVWDHRGTVLLALLAIGFFMYGVTYFFSRAISRPVRAITRGRGGRARRPAATVRPGRPGAGGSAFAQRRARPHDCAAHRARPVRGRLRRHGEP
jgi:hypothetical protein